MTTRTCGKARMALIVVVLWFTFSLCAVLPGEAQPTSIPVGGLFALSGLGASWGQEEYRAAQLAIEEINLSGGIAGTPLELHAEDVSLDKMGRLPAAVQKLASQQRIQALIGPTWDEPARTLMPLLERLRLVSIGSSQGAEVKDGIPESATSYFFSTWPDSGRGVAQLMRYAAARGWKRISIILPIASGFFLYTADQATSFAPKVGLHITSRHDLNNPAAVDFKSVLLRIKTHEHPDAVYVVLSDYSLCPFLRQQEELKFAVPVLSSESSRDIPSLSQCGALMERLYLATPRETEGSRDFSAAYAKRFGGPPLNPSAASSRDAVYALAHALKRASSSGNPDLRAAVQGMAPIPGARLPLIHFEKTGFVETSEESFEVMTVRAGAFVPAT